MSGASSGGGEHRATTTATERGGDSDEDLEEKVWASCRENATNQRLQPLDISSLLSNLECQLI